MKSSVEELSNLHNKMNYVVELVTYSNVCYEYTKYSFKKRRSTYLVL